MQSIVSAGIQDSSVTATAQAEQASLLSRVRRSTQRTRLRVAERIARRISPQAMTYGEGRKWLDDGAFWTYWNAVRKPDGSDLHSSDRKYALWNLTGLVADLTGDVAECGVYQGATARLLDIRLAKSGRTLHLFDSFEGLSTPGVHDGGRWKAGDFACASHDVLKSWDPVGQVEIHPGWFPAAFGDVANRAFILVHIDVDLYEPTLDALEFFHDRVVPGGIMVFDDYGFESTEGAKKAVDEFFAGRRSRIVELPTGQAFVLLSEKPDRVV